MDGYDGELWTLHYSVISLGTILGEIAFIKTSDGGQFGGKSQQFRFKNVVVK